MTTTTSIRYEATGAVANARLSPLLPKDWIDSTTKENNTKSGPIIIPHFLWENAPRKETKDYRDHVLVYSHLPNGSTILDSKWVLGRLFANGHDVADQTKDPLLATCETHCFSGPDGFEDFARRMNLLITDDSAIHQGTTITRASTTTNTWQFPDIMKRRDTAPPQPPSPSPPPPPLWVVKDATANGAGGIWVVGPENAHQFVSMEGPLYDQHKYVAQKYVWPPILFNDKKFHVRVYCVITCDGHAFVHEQAFLHVANEPFSVTIQQDKEHAHKVVFDDCVHITNVRILLVCTTSCASQVFALLHSLYIIYTYSNHYSFRHSVAPILIMLISSQEKF
jgi:hypothetical protein